MICLLRLSAKAHNGSSMADHLSWSHHWKRKKSYVKKYIKKIKNVLEL